jgi:hypothetical protein
MTVPEPINPEKKKKKKEEEEEEEKKKCVREHKPI